MKSKIKLKNVIIYIMLLIVFFGTNVVMASDMTTGINISHGTQGTFSTQGNTILGVFKVIGIISSVGALMLLGVKYMMGSVEQKAEYKKTFPIYLLGCLLVFGISSFLSIIYEFIQGIF